MNRSSGIVLCCACTASCHTPATHPTHPCHTPYPHQVNDLIANPHSADAAGGDVSGLHARLMGKREGWGGREGGVGREGGGVG